MNKGILVIDARTRKICVFVASATLAQEDNPDQLVLRHALDMGELKSLLAPRASEGFAPADPRKRFEAAMPVLVMGTYGAKSSAGHVSVQHGPSGRHDESRHGYRKVFVVGGLGTPFSPKGGLRVLGAPIESVLIRGPVEIEELSTFGNSNTNTADAALAGVKLLASIDRKAVFLMEGQSDDAFVVRLRSLSTEGETAFPTEHREEMFSPENLFLKMLRSGAYWRLSRNMEGCKPSEEQIEVCAKANLKKYLAAHEAGEDRCWEHLGRHFSAFALRKMSVVRKVLADLVGTAPESQDSESLTPAYEPEPADGAEMGD